jgi:hypothetical protein
MPPLFKQNRFNRDTSIPNDTFLPDRVSVV